MWAQYLGRFRREAFHGLEASGYVDARIDPANVRRSGRTRQPTYEQEFKPAVVTAAAECAPAPATPSPCPGTHRGPKVLCSSFTSQTGVRAALRSCGGSCPAVLGREDEESEWESEDDEPGVRHGEEFQVRRTNPHLPSHSRLTVVPSELINPNVPVHEQI